jgi:acyl-CoA reductase-like NAD-dependent aldehyde dehydrogenase
VAAMRSENMAMLRSDFTHSIDGQPATSAHWLDVINPATAEVFARAPSATRAQLDQAVAAARRAFQDWSGTSYEMRRALIGQVAAALRNNQEALAQLLTR